jgi:hypothetical protein
MRSNFEITDIYVAYLLLVIIKGKCNLLCDDNTWAKSSMMLRLACDVLSGWRGFAGPRSYPRDRTGNEGGS